MTLAHANYNRIEQKTISNSVKTRFNTHKSTLVFTLRSNLYKRTANKLKQIT